MKYRFSGEFLSQSFDHYVMIGQIKDFASAFSEVYLACNRHDKTDRVVMKYVDPDGTEVKIHQNVSGLPYICPIKGLTKQNSDYFIVMHYYKFGVAKKLASSVRLTEDDVRHYAAELITGLQSLHEMGVVHRDIKPDNVFLDDDGHLLLADFGESYCPVVFKERNYVDSDVEAGTPMYNSPEMFDGDIYDKPQDIWALGVLLQELFTNTPVFANEVITLKEIEYEVKNKSPPLMEGASESFQHLIHCMLEKNPEKRIGKNFHELKRHPFFEEIDWDAISKKQVAPPFAPHQNGSLTRRKY